MARTIAAAAAVAPAAVAFAVTAAVDILRSNVGRVSKDGRIFDGHPSRPPLRDGTSGVTKSPTLFISNLLG
jgi:hypothetical protein